MTNGAIPRQRVAVSNVGAPAYPGPPFSPGEPYPEYRLGPLGASPNVVYAGVRECFRLLGLDASRYGSREWNPLGEWIRPGMRVLIKPNLVRHYHPYGLDTEAIYTHASVVRAVLDYAWLAMEGEGKLVIADAPLQSCDFDEVCRRSGLHALMNWCEAKSIAVELRDLRQIGRAHV